MLEAYSVLNRQLSGNHGNFGRCLRINRLQCNIGVRPKRINIFGPGIRNDPTSCCHRSIASVSIDIEHLMSSLRVRTYCQREDYEALPTRYAVIGLYAWHCLQRSMQNERRGKFLFTSIPISKNDSAFIAVSALIGKC